MPDGRVGHRAGRLGQQPGMLGYQRIVEELVVRGPRTDQQRVGGVGHAAHLVQPAHVDQQFRIRQAKPRRRKQALPAMTFAPAPPSAGVHGTVTSSMP